MGFGLVFFPNKCQSYKIVLMESLPLLERWTDWAYAYRSQDFCQVAELNPLNILTFSTYAYLYFNINNFCVTKINMFLTISYWFCSTITCSKIFICINNGNTVKAQFPFKFRIRKSVNKIRNLVSENWMLRLYKRIKMINKTWWHRVDQNS